MDEQIKKGFLEVLFDFSFSSFVSTKLIKVLYGLSLVGAAVLAIFFIASGFSVGTGTGLFTLIVIAPLVFLGVVLYSRVLMELMIVVFRISENVQEIATTLKDQAGQGPV